MCDFVTFLDVIEAEVDINVKIAKILADKNRWQMKFTFSRGTKFSMLIPIDDTQMTQEIFDRQRGKIKDEHIEDIAVG